MKLEVFDKYTRIRVGMIKTYTYVTYTDGLRDYGSFEIRIPESEESLEYLTEGNYIWFEDNIVGIIKGYQDSEENDLEITLYGYLINYILTYRSNLLAYKKYDKIGIVARSMFTDLFIQPEDTRRIIDFLGLDQDTSDETKFPKKSTYVNTGKSFFEYLEKIFEPNGLGFELLPVLTYTSNGATISQMNFRVITPRDKTFGNSEGYDPIVFSFDLNNLLSIEYEEDGRKFKNVAFVASEGEGEERKTLEVGDSEATGLDRIELYVDARDIQSDADPEHPLTDEEVEELMQERGEEKLSECVKFKSFSASLNSEDTKYVYGVDFYKGDYVSVIDKRINKKVNIQITEITKSISNGVEHLDITFGTSMIDILNKKERRIYNV